MSPHRATVWRVLVLACTLVLLGTGCGVFDDDDQRAGDGRVMPGTPRDHSSPPGTDGGALGEAPTDGPLAEETPLDQLPPGERPPPEPEIVDPEPAPLPGRPEDDGVLEPGEEGDAVRLTQERLGSLGYWVGEIDGRYGHLTQQAVLAFQKVEGLDRDGITGPQTMERMALAVRPVPAQLTDGMEIDLERQVLFIVRGGQVIETYNTSTGEEGWTTPGGSFEIDRQIDGLRVAPLGELWRPKYFNGGIAVHGSNSIPAYPASHGCTRISNAGIDHLWADNLLPIGTPVVVH